MSTVSETRSLINVGALNNLRIFRYFLLTFMNIVIRPSKTGDAAILRLSVYVWATEAKVKNRD